MLKNENKYIYGENEQQPSHTMLQQQLSFLNNKNIDHVYIADGNSTDDSKVEYTCFPLHSHPNITVFQQQEFNENLTLNQLIQIARKDGHKWLLNLDGDEILEDSSLQFLKQFTESHDETQDHTVRFNYINLWRSRKRFRVDKWFNAEAGKFFSLTDRLCSIGSSFNNHHFSFNENSYDGGNIYYANKKILHYAWVNWKSVTDKYARFINLEMDHNKTNLDEAEKMYREILNEEGIVLQSCFDEWAEEYRTGVIQYAET